MHTLNPAEVHDLFQLPVSAVFPDDYRAVQTSIRSGAPIGDGSAIFKSLSAFASSLNDAPERPRKTHKFIEFVNLPVFSYWRRAEMRSEKWV
ncbi:MAG TPA: hypothetical protein VIX12_02310 [Candidatus Binataceae bacterium]